MSSTELEQELQGANESWDPTILALVMSRSSNVVSKAGLSSHSIA